MTGFRHSTGRTGSVPLLVLLVVSALLLLLATGCGGKKGEKQRADATTGQKVDSTNGAPLTDQLNAMADEGQLPLVSTDEIPPEQPVWPQGTTFTPQSKDATIIARTQRLEAIYHRAQERYGTKLQGRVTLRFVVDTKGTVDKVSVVDSWWNKTGATVLTDSLTEDVARWTFPPGLEKPVRIVQPWRFNP